MVKLVAVDMDGTLLNNASEISPGNIRAIKEMQAAGAEFLICTGRDSEDARNVVEEAGISCGYITMSGAATFDQEGRQLTSFPLSAEASREICSVFRQNCVYHEFITSKGFFNTFSPEETKRQFETNFLAAVKAMGKDTAKFEARLKVILQRIHHISSIEELLENEAVDIYKFTTSSPDRSLIAYMKTKLAANPQLAVASTFPTNIEVTDIRAQKGIALKAYADKKGISMAEVMAIGDSENDYSMLSMDFGYTVAMENGDDEIKAISKYLTKSNEEDGVAWAIRKYVLNQQ